MKIYGYEKENEVMIELQEVTVKCDITEIEQLIEFLQNVKESHNNIEAGVCHSHFQDWSNEWKKGMADIIIMTGPKWSYENKTIEKINVDHRIKHHFSHRGT